MTVTAEDRSVTRLGPALVAGGLAASIASLAGLAAALLAREDGGGDALQIATFSALATLAGASVCALLLRDERARREALAYALQDGLTGLASRPVLERAIGEALRARASAAVIVVEVGELAARNRASFAIGDQELRRAATVVKGACRSVDLVGRWSGSRFVVLMPNASASDARFVAERMRRVRDLTLAIGVAELAGAKHVRAVVDSATTAASLAAAPRSTPPEAIPANVTYVRVHGRRVG